MKKFFYSGLVIGVGLLGLISSMPCPPGQIEVRLADPEPDNWFETSTCIDMYDSIEDCRFYDKNDLAPPLTCVKCQESHFVIKFLNEDVTQCVRPFQNPVFGCIEFANLTLLECVKCSGEFTELKIGTAVNGQDSVQCTIFDEITGDGVDFSDCEIYQEFSLLDFFPKCEQCLPLNSGVVPASADCSLQCDGDQDESLYVYRKSNGQLSRRCNDLPKAFCKIFRNFFLTSCEQCFPEDTLVVTYFHPFGPSLNCIPTERLIPGCVMYQHLDLNKCIKCQQSGVPPVKQTFFKEYDTCAPDPSYLIGSCKRLGSDGVSCAECFHRHWLDYELNRCVLLVEYCANYTKDTGECQRCIPGFILIGQECRQVAPECLTYNEITGVCIDCILGYVPSENMIGVCVVDYSCSEGFYYDQDFQGCLPGQIPNCLFYELGGIQCLQCSEGYTPSRFGDSCQLIEVPVVCPEEAGEGFIWKVEMGECKKESVGCLRSRVNSSPIQMDTNILYCEVCRAPEYYMWMGLCFEVNNG